MVAAAVVAERNEVQTGIGGEGRSDRKRVHRYHCQSSGTEQTARATCWKYGATILQFQIAKEGGRVMDQQKEHPTWSPPGIRIQVSGDETAGEEE